MFQEQPSRREVLGSALCMAVTSGKSESDAKPTGLIDCQTHLLVPELLDRMSNRKSEPRVVWSGEDRLIVQGPWIRKVLPNHSDPEKKIAAMDAAGVSRAALSLNDPGPELFEEDGPAVARMAHDWLADICRRYPDRFFGLATLPVQNMTAALKELDRCVNRLGFRGILMYSNLRGRFPDELEYRPIFEAAASENLPILLHPALPVVAEQVSGYDQISGLGNMFDTTIALNRLIMSGIFDRYENLKLVCPHLGGTLPYIIGRIDHQNTILKRGPRLKRKPSEYLAQVWLDAVSPLPSAVRLAHEIVGPDRMLFASDHPWVEPSLIRDSVLAARLPATSEAKLFRENAETLFNL